MAANCRPRFTLHDIAAIEAGSTTGHPARIGQDFHHAGLASGN